MDSIILGWFLFKTGRPQRVHVAHILPVCAVPYIVLCYYISIVLILVMVFYLLVLRRLQHGLHNDSLCICCLRDIITKTKNTVNVSGADPGAFFWCVL